MSPSSSFERCTRFPFSSVPFVEPRSTSHQLPPSRRSSAWRRETFASSTWMSLSFERPSTTLAPSSACVRPFIVSEKISFSSPSSAGETASVGCGGFAL